MGRSAWASGRNIRRARWARSSGRCHAERRDVSCDTFTPKPGMLSPLEASRMTARPQSEAGLRNASHQPTRNVLSHRRSFFMPVLPDLSFGAADRGFPLPDRLRRPMERLFGVSFEAVRVHIGPQAAALGVPAFNHGSDIYFAPGVFNPDSSAGVRVIAHELAHVRQQQQGRVPRGPAGTHVQFLLDPRLEAEADQMGALAAGEGLAVEARPQPITDHGGYQWHALQATLKFRGADGRVREFRDAEEAYREIRDNVSGAFHTFFVHVKRDIVPILKEWISAQGGDDPKAWRIRKEMGQQRHILEFGDYTNMARAVMGEFLAREALDGSETRLARATVQSRYIATHLAALLDKVRMKVSGPSAPRMLAPLLDEKADLKLPYQPLYKKSGANIARVLKQPDAYYFEDRIVTLHDVTEFLKKNHKSAVEVPPEKSMGTYFRINELGKPEYSRRIIQGTADFRYKPEANEPDRYTLKENSGYVMAARVQGVPIWAGPSFTTGRLMRMAEWAGATRQEYEALAWAIFAFWNQCYPTSSTWVHRFHEVMDMAANWGVPFMPFTYPSDIPPNAGSLRARL
ncbi:DUF4157 domain-containing protein [Aquabacterium sp. A7-Y]|uniref:eCIS core domain-containing protein n=1 Tax=Aquabacterium sp. A7-Y TaxID=1349605 RepID=UPI00223DA7D2|nr:DUF4157 domain-containing protein [Aquabacterium sp. A7-Y]MCW7539382.1 DUF4157 domain-containing protein [Aquabacterium sp. A7-Y]